MELNIVLHNPEIPQNTGNISRTCACVGARLHLIHPLGFKINEREIKRAGLDYWKYVKILEYWNLEDFFEKNEGGNFYYVSTKGKKFYTQFEYKNKDYFMFGKESAGLPKDLLLKNEDKVLRIPMSQDTKLRSLNLSNSVAIITYEAFRQWNFTNLN